MSAPRSPEQAPPEEADRLADVARRHGVVRDEMRVARLLAIERERLGVTR